MANADDAASQRKQRDMNVDPAFEASTQLAEGCQPGVCTLDHPAMTPEPVIALDATPGKKGSICSAAPKQESEK